MNKENVNKKETLIYTPKGIKMTHRHMKNKPIDAEIRPDANRNTVMHTQDRKQLARKRHGLRTSKRKRGMNEPE